MKQHRPPTSSSLMASAGSPRTGWQRYAKLHMLGHGAYGTVYLARDLTVKKDDDDEFVAVKAVPLMDVGEREKAMAMAEVAILRQLEHKNVLRLLDCFVDDDSFLCSVTEFIDGGDLSDFLRKAMEGRGDSFDIDALVVADLAEQLLEGLAYLHANHVLHRDVKPQNFYITKSGVVKIGDFGVSKLLTASMPHAGTFIGTPYYMAPEVCLGEKYSFAADVWSIGVVLYELYCGHLPFQANNVLALINCVTEGRYNEAALDSRPYSTSPDASSLGAEMRRDVCALVASLVKACLRVDCDERPSAAALLYEYFRKGTPSGIVWADDGMEIASHEDWTGTAAGEEAPQAAGHDAALAGAVTDGADAGSWLEARQPSWLHHAEALSKTPTTSLKPPGEQHPQPPTAALTASAADVPPLARSHVDPAALREQIYQRAVVLHKKRLARERANRMAAAAIAERKAKEQAEQSAADAEAATRAASMGRLGDAPDVRIGTVASGVPASMLLSSNLLASGATAAAAAGSAEPSPGGGPVKPLSPVDLARGSASLQQSVQRLALAMSQDPARRAIAQALLGSVAPPAGDDEDGDDEPLSLNLLTSDRILPMKGKRGMSYKKLQRKLRKALGLDADEPIVGQLYFKDNDGDEVLIQSKREWRHAVDEHVARGSDVLVLRLHDPASD